MLLFDEFDKQMDLIKRGTKDLSYFLQKPRSFSMASVSPVIADNYQNNMTLIGSQVLTTTFATTLRILPTEAIIPPLAHLKTYSLEEVSRHYSLDDCWVVVYDKIYDLGEFLREHPGGEEVILEYAGRDATLAFRGVGHSTDAMLVMEKYCVGVLIEEERIYLRKKKISIFG